MGNPNSALSIGIPFTSYDGKYYSRYPQGDAPGGGGGGAGQPPLPNYSASAFVYPPAIPGGAGNGMDVAYAFRNNNQAWAGGTRLYLCNKAPNVGLTQVNSGTWSGGSGAAFTDDYPNRVILLLWTGMHDANLLNQYREWDARGNNVVIVGHCVPNVSLKGTLLSCRGGAAHVMGVRFFIDVANPLVGPYGSNRGGIGIGDNVDYTRGLLSNCEIYFSCDQSPTFYAGYTQYEPTLKCEIGMWECLFGFCIPMGVHEWADGDPTLCNRLYPDPLNGYVDKNYCGSFPSGYFEAHGAGPFTGFNVSAASMIRCVDVHMGGRNPLFYSKRNCIANSVIYNHGYTRTTPWPTSPPGPAGASYARQDQEGVALGWHPNDPDPNAYQSTLLVNNLWMRGPDSNVKPINTQYWNAHVVDHPAWANSRYRLIDNHGFGYGTITQQTDFATHPVHSYFWATGRVTPAEAWGIGADGVNSFSFAQTQAAELDFLDRLQYCVGVRPRHQESLYQQAAFTQMRNYRNSTGSGYGTTYDNPASYFGYPSGDAHIEVDWTNQTHINTYFGGRPIPIDPATRDLVDGVTGRTPLEQWVLDTRGDHWGYPPALLRTGRAGAMRAKGRSMIVVPDHVVAA